MLSNGQEIRVDLADINVDRAFPYAAPAAYAGYRTESFGEILQLVHETVSHPLEFESPRIVTGRVQGEQGKHA